MLLLLVTNLMSNAFAICNRLLESRAVFKATNSNPVRAQCFGDLQSLRESRVFNVAVEATNSNPNLRLSLFGFTHLLILDLLV